MFLNLIGIRFSQIYRGIVDIGLVRAIIIMLVFVPFIFLFIYNKLQTTNYNYIITGVALLLVFIIHRKRKDYNFIFKVSKYPVLTYYLEYLFFSIPLILIFICAKQYLHIVIYTILLIAISFSIPTSKTNKAYLSIIKYIPSGMFEIQSGVRKNIFPFIIFYIFGLLGFMNIWFSAISVFILIMIICSFYSECESRKLIEASELDASKFIKKKLKRHIKYLIFFMLPIFLVSLVHYEYWLYIIACFLIVINLQIGAILLKYAYYRPNIISGTHQLLGSIILLLSVILPVSIIFLFLNVLLYNKSVQNLNSYLNVYN